MKIGIICAVEKEIWVLRDNLQEIEVTEIAGNKIHCCKLGHHDVAIMLCGVGKVSAAIATQVMIDHFHPDKIINSGSAGALSHTLGVGDIVLSSACVEHDMSVLELNHPQGYIFSLDTVEMPADKDLADMIEASIPDEIHVERGLVASGDQFIASQAQRDEILKNFPNALVAEMEGAAVAHVCMQNKVPYCVLRCISDNADGNSNTDYWEFAPKAGKRSAEILINMLKQQN